ncbi:hypothetical protein AB0C52_28135 [Streptomyces sp. NPDC048717]|uniref:hypothetical protein n=1 Tax=Streptomyces sp. NPDC048717 TaxID=3154928 RepID=UPI003436E7CB
MAGEVRTADIPATRNGIMALESAFTGILRSRQDVEAMRNNLSTGYQGSDGHSYTGLIEKWEGHADTILRNLDEMIGTLNHTLSSMRQNQGSSNEAINQAYHQSEAIFDQLTGG